MRSSRAGLTLLASLLLSLAPSTVRSEDVFVWKTTVKIAAKQALFRQNDPTDILILRKLKNDDIVNLALGRPLGTKVDKNTEILAMAGTFEDSGSTPISRLIVFDPSQNGLAQVKATVIRGTTLQFQSAYLGATSGDVGTGTATIQATTLGNFAQNGFLSTTIFGSGEGTGSHLAPPDFSPLGVKLKVKATLVGPITFNATPGGQFDGVIIKGEAKVSGKPIGMFTE